MIHNTFLHLCDTLPAATELEVLNIELRLTGNAAGKAKQVAEMAKAKMKGEKTKELMYTPPQPDVVIFFDPTCTFDAEPTIWVVCRGSVTLTDFYGDIQWLKQVNYIGNLRIPELPSTRANFCYPKLEAFVKKMGAKYGARAPRNLYFAGHSLGGAVAGGLFLKYHMMTKTPLNTRLISLGCPQM